MLDNRRSLDRAPGIRRGIVVRATLVGVMLCAGALGIHATSQTPPVLPQTIPSEPDGREFILRVTPAPAPNACVFNSFQTGAFGGYGSYASTLVRNLGGGAFALRTGLGGKPATTLKIAVWCRGYGMALVDVAALESSTFERSISLTPRNELPMTGRLLPSSDGVSLADATLRVYYNADWLCEFFNLADCMVPTWEVAVDRIADVGTFRVMVPDFAGDPVVAKSPGGTPRASTGSFSLRADRNAAPYHYWLEPEGATFSKVPVASAYPSLVLRPRPH
jgi:hypothetical protein